MKVVSQLPEHLNELFRHAAPGIEIVLIDMGDTNVPYGADILLAAPFALAGQEMPDKPVGWPFDLRWIQLVTVGLDFYPQWMFDDVPVIGGFGRASVRLAEFAFTAILAGAKGLPGILVHSVEEWGKRPPIRAVEGSTLGLYGFGGLGQAITPWAQAMGMKMAAVRKSNKPLPPGVRRVPDIASLFEVSDHVVLAAPGTAETAGIVNRAALERVRPGCHLINVARGILIEDDALLEALDQGNLARVTLDVTHPEPLPAEHPFFRHPNIFLTPHLATNTPDHLASIARQFAENLQRYKSGKELLHQVRPESGE